MTDTAYFQLLEHPLSARDAPGRLYCSPGDDTAALFRQVNGLRGNEMLYPGHFLLTPSLDGISPQGISGLQSMSQQVNYLQRNSAAPSDPRAFNNDFDMLAMLSGNSDTLDKAGNAFGGVSEYLTRRIKLIERDFKQLERTYDYATSHGIKLNSPQFKALRRPIEEALKEQLRGLEKSKILRNAYASSMKDAVGISHKSIRNSVRINGNPAKIKPIAQTIDRAKNFSKTKLGKFGWIGTILTISSTVPAIVDDYKKEGLRGGLNATAREAVGVGGGILAGEAAASAATAAMLLFGVGTGGVGFIVIGLGAAAAGMLAGSMGQEYAKEGYDKMRPMVSKGGESLVEIIMKAN